MNLAILIDTLAPQEPAAESLARRSAQAAAAAPTLANLASIAQEVSAAADALRPPIPALPQVPQAFTTTPPDSRRAAGGLGINL
ncbi:hypothetical protein D9M69_482790 [compost metagenome]